MFRLTVVTCLWQRPEIATIALRHLADLRVALEGPIRLDVVAVGSEGQDSRDLAEAHGAVYVEYENQPLGAKWNAGLRKAKLLDTDCVLVLGSDNIANEALFTTWADLIASGRDYLGFLDGYMLEAHSGRMIHWFGYPGTRAGEPLGSGRCYSRRLLDRCGWLLWDSSLRQGLDWSVTRRLKSLGFVKSEIAMMDVHGIRHIGIKSGVNMGSFASLLRNSSDRIEHVKSSVILDWFGPRTGQAILDLKGKIEAPPEPGSGGTRSGGSRTRSTRPESVGPSRRKLAMLETIAELRDKVVCPRCRGLTSTREVVVLVQKRPGEAFLCLTCAQRVNQEGEHEQSPGLLDPREAVPSVQDVQDEPCDVGSVQRGQETVRRFSVGEIPRDEPEEFRP